MELNKLKHSTITDVLNETLIHKWDHIINVVGPNDIYVRETTVSESDKYIFDLNGLLESFNVPEKYWFIHIRLNNYKTSSCYDGKKDILMLDNEFLDKIYSTITNNS